MKFARFGLIIIFIFFFCNAIAQNLVCLKINYLHSGFTKTIRIDDLGIENGVFISIEAEVRNNSEFTKKNRISQKDLILIKKILSNENSFKIFQKNIQIKKRPCFITYDILIKNKKGIVNYSFCKNQLCLTKLPIHMKNLLDLLIKFSDNSFDVCYVK